MKNLEREGNIEVSKEFKVNDYITLKLEVNPWEGYWETVIYVNERRFDQCKFLLLDIPIEKIKTFDEIESIDEAAEKLDRSLENINKHSEGIPPDVEFWGHCSNLQVWFENDYDSRLLHRNLAFPLLKKLTELEDPLAKRMFKEEIAKRMESGHYSVIEYLKEGKYLNYLNYEERYSLIKNLKSKNIKTEYVEFKEGLYEFVINKKLDLREKGIKEITDIKGLDTFTELEELLLCDNEISEIKGLESLISLKKLYIRKNQISEIKGLNHLVNLEELHLNNNIISEIKGLENLVNLRVLWIDQNNIKKIRGLENLTNLVWLSLNGNQIVKIENLDNLVNLATLSFWRNNIEKISGLENLVKLENIDLKKNNIKEIKGLENLINLKTLCLNNNKISEIKGIETLKNLESLNLSKNLISEVKGLENFKKLQWLNLEDNAIPESFFRRVGEVGFAQNCVRYCREMKKALKKTFIKSKRYSIIPDRNSS